MLLELRTTGDRLWWWYSTVVVRGARLAARLVVVLVVVVVVELVVCSSGCSRKSFSLDDSQRGHGRHSAKISNLWCRNRVACRTKNRAGAIFFFLLFFFSLLMWRFLQIHISSEKKKKVRISSDFAISYRGKSSRNRVVRKSSPPSRDGKGKPEEVQTRARTRTRTRPASPRSARASPRQERERERERSAQGDHVLRRQVLGVSRRKKGGKKKPRDTSQHNQSPDPRFPSSLLDTARNTGRSPRW